MAAVTISAAPEVESRMERGSVRVGGGRAPSGRGGRISRLQCTLDPTEALDCAGPVALAQGMFAVAGLLEQGRERGRRLPRHREIMDRQGPERPPRPGGPSRGPPAPP